MPEDLKLDIKPVETSNGEDDDPVHIVCCLEPPYSDSIIQLPTMCGKKLTEKDEWREGVEDEDFCKFCLYLAKEGHCPRGGSCARFHNGSSGDS